MDVYSFLKASFASKEKNIVHEGRGGKADGIDPLPLQTPSVSRLRVTASPERQPFVHSPAVSSASTSARAGAAALPPKRVHLRPAAAAAKRSAPAAPRPSMSASAKAP
jgi:hypothetical protein